MASPELERRRREQPLGAGEIPPETAEFFGGDELRIRIFLDKYALKGEKGEILERIPPEMWRRIAREIASVEAPDRRDEWEKRFYWLLEDFRFIPGGRIMFGAGQPRRATLFNCYVIPIKEDSIEGIFDWCKEAARTYSFGGGAGVDLSILRPKGSPVNNAAIYSTGSVSFMDLLSTTTGTIGQCLAEGTLILMENGWTPIEEAEEGDLVWTDQGWKPITYIFPPREREVFRIRTKMGYEILASADHKFVNLPGSLRPLKELRVGDTICLLRGQGDGATPLQRLQTITHQRYPSNNSNRLRVLTQPEVLDEDLAYLLGYYFADGSNISRDKTAGGEDRHQGISWTVPDDQLEIQEKLYRLSSALFGLEPTVKERPNERCTSFRISSKWLYRFLKANNLLKERSEKMTIPDLIKRSPADVTAAFLAGYFDGDGYASGRKRSYVFATTSQEMAADIRRELLRLGIISKTRVQVQKRSGNWRDIYTVSVVGKSSQKLLIRWLGLHSLKVQKSHHISKRDCILTPFTSRDLGIRSNRYSYVPDPSQQLSVATLERHQEGAEVEVEDCRAKSKPESREALYVRDEIIEIEPVGTRITYDIEVAEAHKFVAEGFYVSNSGRRGALMITLRVDHPDIFDFIEAKQDLSKVNYANISVRISDSFMEAVERAKDFTLWFENEVVGRVEKRIQARELWRRLVQAAWEAAEPGVIFWDTIKRESTTEYNGMGVITTNPCSLTGETRVFTPQGLIRLDELVATAVERRESPLVLIDRRAQDRCGIEPVVADRVAFTGIKPIWRVETTSGFVIRGTGDHKVKVLNYEEYDPDHGSTGWKRIDELRPGDLLALPDLNDEEWVERVFAERSWELSLDLDEAWIQPRRRDAHYHLIDLPTRWTEDLGYLLGYAVGDGSYTNHSKSGNGRLWSRKLVLHMNAQEADEIKPIIDRVTQSTLGTTCTLRTREGTRQAWINIFAAPFQGLLHQLGLEPCKSPEKHVPESIFRAPREITAAFLRGLFDADGTVATDHTHPMISLSSTSPKLIQEVQLLLLQFGIFSSVTVHRAEEKNRTRSTRFRYVTVAGEEREYLSKHDVYKLYIADYPSIERFLHYIGSSIQAKRKRIEDLLRHRGHRQEIRPVTVATKVKRVVQEGIAEPVYDLTVLDTKSFIGNGLIVSNSEIPLEPYGCCNLGSINLAAFVVEEFTPKAHVDWEELEKALRYGVRFLDDVLDYGAERHPLPQQREASLRSRRIGLGFTGLGDFLIKLGLKYDAEEAIEFVDQLFNKIKHIVYDESIKLAKEKGPFPAFDVEQHMKSPFIKRLDPDLQKRLKEHGLRNGALLTVPPVGSGSALAGVSSGIEPLFSLSYLRRSESLAQREFKVFHPLVREYLERFKVEEQDLPPTFITAHEIAPEMRIRMQAAIQKHIDHSISSTVNLPKEATLEDVERIFLEAWRLGCKGVTVYREGSRRGIMVTKAETEGEAHGPEPGLGLELELEPELEQPRHRRSARLPRPRPKVVRGKTYNFRTEMGSLFVTVNEDEHGPFEVFVQLGKSGSASMAFTEAIGRLISLALRSGLKPSAIIDQLQLIRGSRPVIQEDGEIVFSVPDAIAKAMAAYLKGGEQLKLIDNHQDQGRTERFKLFLKGPAKEAGEDKPSMGMLDLCPMCGGVLEITGGCYLCRDCGYTRCD